MAEKKLKVTLQKSLIKRLKSHKACAKGLGLTKIRQSVVVQGTPENLGLINKISYLLNVEEVEA